MWNIPYAFLLLHITNYAVVHGSTKEDAATLIAYVGIGSTFGRIATGLSNGQNDLDPVLLNFGFNGLVGFLTIFFPFIQIPSRDKLLIHVYLEYTLEF